MNILLSGPFLNIDLLSVAITIAAICLLGFMAFFSNPKSITNKTFLFLALSATIWSVVNYLSYQSTDPNVALWLLRAILFSAVWYCFALFQLFYVFPVEKFAFPKWYMPVLLPVAAIVAFFTLTPITLKNIVSIGGAGQVPIARPGPGIAIFGFLVLGLTLSAFTILGKKLKHSEGVAKKQYGFVLAGAIFTFTLHIIFNFILPAFFNQTRFIPLGAIFIFPLIAFTTYAIVRHHLLNIKVFAAQTLTFVLAVTTFAEVIFAQSIAAILFQGAVFLLVLSFGILLIRSVLREVEQREELERLDKELEGKNKQLNDLSRFKSELLSLASHQIRSPLAAIKGFGSLIADGSYGPVSDTVKATVLKMSKSADELIGLINTLLDLRKVEEGKMEYQFARTDLTKIVTEVTELLKPLAETKKLAFSFASPGREVWVSADGEKLKQVVQNLVDNAIKYTQSGFVSVELKGDGAKAIVSVSDSGVGVPSSLLPYLFEEFVRDERVKKQILGTGLGLYIARKIAEAHSGHITAESAGEGKGSTFRITLPETK